MFVVDQKVLGPPLLDQAGNRVPVTWKNCSVIAARCTTTAEQQQQDEQFGDKAEMDLGNAKSMRKLRVIFINSRTLQGQRQKKFFWRGTENFEGGTNENF